MTGEIPLVRGSDGVIRIRSTRVTLDTLVAAFDQGATAEEIVQRYPSVSLADVYQAIGYYLQHSKELEQEYFTIRSKAAGEVRASNESRWQPQGVRGRLMSRRNE